MCVSGLYARVRRCVLRSRKYYHVRDWYVSQRLKIKLYVSIGHDDDMDLEVRRTRYQQYQCYFECILTTKRSKVARSTIILLAFN